MKLRVIASLRSFISFADFRGFGRREKNAAVLRSHSPLSLKHPNGSNPGVLLTNESPCPRGVLTHFQLRYARARVNMAAPRGAVKMDEINLIFFFFLIARGRAEIYDRHNLRF